MKLIIAIIRDSDCDNVSRALTSSNFRVTSIASTGGFLRRGQTTLLIGLDDEHVDSAMDIIRSNCSTPPEPNTKRATIFVVKVDRFVHF